MDKSLVERIHRHVLSAVLHHLLTILENEIKKEIRGTRPALKFVHLFIFLVYRFPQNYDDLTKMGVHIKLYVGDIVSMIMK